MRLPAMAAVFLLSAVAPAVLAQEGQQPPGATAPTTDPAAEYKQLVKDYNAAFSAWQKALQKAAAEAEQAATDGKPVPALPMTPPSKEFVDRALELAETYAGKDEAIRFLVFILKNATTETNAVTKAFRTIVADHGSSPEIEGALRFLGRAERVIGKQRVLDGLATIESDNKSPAVLANVYLLRGRILLENAQDDAERATAVAELEKVATATKDEDLVKEAEGLLFEVKHLAIGCTVPEIAAEDMDGVKFKLSDYRGKVVLLDFWGFW